MRKISSNILKNNKMKMVLIFSFLMTVAVSFSATGGAKYIAPLITVMEDLFSDGRKAATAFGILMAALMGILVAVGGATLEKKHLGNNIIIKQEKVRE